MNKHARKLFIFTTMALYAIAVRGASLLQPASFPKTFQDIPFADRMAVKAEGYDPFESVYDENGNCISGCAYQGITLEDELTAIQRATEIANQKLELYKRLHPEEFKEQQPAPQETTPPKAQPQPQPQPSQKPPVTTPTITQTITQTQPVQPPAPTTTTAPEPGLCQSRTDAIVPRDFINQAPLTYNYTIASRFGPRKSFRTTNGNRSTSVHKGIDLSAPTGTDVYAAANGVVTKVQNQPNGCGLWIEIEHANDFKTQYCHLSKQLARVGDRVQAGCLIGRVGSTGNVTGPHLHYVVKQGGTHINPEPYLPKR